MSNYGRAGDSQRINFYDAHEWALDKSVTPHTLCYGMMGKDHDALIHAWRYLRVSSSGAISNDDAANFRVSAIGLTGLDISNSDATDFRVSSIEMNYKQVFAYHATYTDDIEYIGKAVPGTATSAVSTWQIQKLTYLAAGKVSGVLWAEGSDSFDREWDERASYTYN